MLLFLMFLLADSPAGTWRGESLCTPSAGAACKNETVVYYMREVAGDPGSLSVRADKIVDGKAITMGEGPWKYDREKNTLSWELPRQVWLLRIDGREIEGTLTLADKSIVRQMKLTKAD